MSKETDRRIAAATDKLKAKGVYLEVLKAAGAKNADKIQAARTRGKRDGK